MLYYFILGQSPKLSVLEIYSLLTKEGFDFTLEKFSAEVLLVDFKTEINAQEILDSLGGTVKLGQILAQTTADKITPPFLISYFSFTESNKFHFGFSTYQLGPAKFKLPKNFGLEIKKTLKAKGISSRLVTSREPNLSSVTVAKNRLLKNGAEICFLAEENQIYLGKTLAVQKFGEYSKLDYGRPERDVYSGMLPPKVAKIMINLAQLPSLISPLSKMVPSPSQGKGQGGVLDPFCGSGTILQQAILLGYKNLVGSDISSEAIKNTETNIQYLISNIQYPISPPKLYTLDVLNLSSRVKPKSIGAIITEPYLGPPLKGNESQDKIKQIITELSDLYLKSFAEFKKILQPGGKVVIIFPIIKGQPSVNNQQLLQIKNLGFQPGLDLPSPLQSLLTPRGSIVYSRPGQMVEREIFVFQL